MTDQCQHCTLKGDYKKCNETECSHHENWINKERLAKIWNLKEEVKRLEKELEESKVACGFIECCVRGFPTTEGVQCAFTGERCPNEIDQEECTDYEAYKKINKGGAMNLHEKLTEEFKRLKKELYKLKVEYINICEENKEADIIILKNIEEIKRLKAVIEPWKG